MHLAQPIHGRTDTLCSAHWPQSRKPSSRATESLGWLILTVLHAYPEAFLQDDQIGGEFLFHESNTTSVKSVFCRQKFASRVRFLHPICAACPVAHAVSAFDSEAGASHAKVYPAGRACHRLCLSSGAQRKPQTTYGVIQRVLDAAADPHVGNVFPGFVL
jgi:hypothetical protein